MTTGSSEVRSTPGTLLLAVLILITSLGGQAAAAKPDAREIEARALFAKGEYPGAADLFARLFAEKHDPVFLRNLGRCYQRLREPRKAIDRFEEYLAKARKLSAKEKREIKGFIDEMEALERTQASAPTAPPPTVVEPIGPPVDLTPVVAPSGWPTDATALSAAPVTISDQVAPTAPPVYKRWWFWAVVGGAVAATAVGIGAATGMFSQAQNACPPGIPCK